MARPQVASYRLNLIFVRFVDRLRRSLRLQQRRHLIGQPGSQRGPLPHLQFGPLPDPPRGLYPAPLSGLQQGRRREYQYFGAIADSPDVRNQQRTEHTQQPTWAVNVPFIALSRKGRSACLLLTRHSAQFLRLPGVNNNSEECK